MLLARFSSSLPMFLKSETYGNETKAAVFPVMLLCTMYQLMYYPVYQCMDAGGIWYLVPPGKVFAQGGICRSHVIIFVFYRLLHAGVIVTAKAKASFVAEEYCSIPLIKSLNGEHQQ